MCVRTAVCRAADIALFPFFSSSFSKNQMPYCYTLYRILYGWRMKKNSNWNMYREFDRREMWRKTIQKKTRNIHTLMCGGGLVCALPTYSTDCVLSVQCSHMNEKVIYMCVVRTLDLYKHHSFRDTKVPTAHNRVIHVLERCQISMCPDPLGHSKFSFRILFRFCAPTSCSDPIVTFLKPP